MTALATSHPLDRYTEIGELSDKVRAAIKRIITPLSVALAIEAGWLGRSSLVGAEAFAMIAGGTLVVLLIWSRAAIGLPLMPMMAVQSLVIYGTPIAVGHENILTYPAEFEFQAGIEVLVFNLAMAAAWKVGMQLFHPSRPISYVLQEFNRKGVRGWIRLGFGLIIGVTLFEVLQGLSLLDPFFAVMPSGINSIVYALLSATSACGFFLVSMILGETSFLGQIVFWVLLIANAMLLASDFLLASAAANLITVAIGFFWANGRIPGRYLIVTMLSLSFLNTGKYTMRERYWTNADSEGTQIAIVQLPAVFLEWVEASFDAIVANGNASSEAVQGKTQANKNQTLLDRIDNLQNLLFVIDAVKSEHISLLKGDTYTLIPPLLMPRIFWPNKPRTHEGQILLNVHFGRQDMDSTFTTYIAWGLLPEAYGNFGPIVGATILGAFLGTLFAWIENISVRKLVVSMEGFLALCLLMNLMNSFEMVASILVTSTFQSMAIIVVASLPFVHRTITIRHATDTQ